VYESLAEGPDALLLLMDHVPYTHVLHSGKTVIQHIYESHYKGAAPAASYVQQWKSRVTRIDEQRYRELLARLEYQAGHAEVWRDAVNSWFLRTSGIPNRKGGVGLKRQHRIALRAELLRSQAMRISSRATGVTSEGPEDQELRDRPLGRYRWGICALLFFATTINYIDRQVLESSSLSFSPSWAGTRLTTATSSLRSILRTRWAMWWPGASWIALECASGYSWRWDSGAWLPWGTPLYNLSRDSAPLVLAWGFLKEATFPPPSKRSVTGSRKRIGRWRPACSTLAATWAL
jgi:hypothetical protein